MECLSLSPDGTRLAFKQARGGDPARGWRLTVINLATTVRTPLADTSSVDDQGAWLDNQTVMYVLRRTARDPDVWSVPSSGQGHPTCWSRTPSPPQPSEACADLPHTGHRPRRSTARFLTAFS